MMRLGLAALALAAFAFPASAQEGEQQFVDLGTCGAIEDCRIGYRTFGTLNEAGDNAVLIPAWYTGTSEQEQFLVQPPFLDPDVYFVILVDPIGNGVSISPSNSASQPLGEFPEFTIGDMVDSQHRLLTEHLGIDHLAVVMGISMGGMQSFEWSARYPGFADKVIPIVGSPQLPSFDIVMWDTRNALYAMERACDCAEVREIAAGISVTAAPREMADSTVPRKDAADLIETRGAAGSLDIGQSWDLQRQAEAMMTHDVAQHFGGDLAEAARSAGAHHDMLVIVAREDRIVTPGPALEFARVAGATTVILDAGCGHGDFSCDTATTAAAVNAFLHTND